MAERFQLELFGPTLSFHALDENLALLAGAGAGKTFNLVTLCLHLLAGARRLGSRVEPSQLCLVTFTEKAATELRQRLRARVEVLARDAEAAEPELRASLAALGRPMPPLEQWQAVLDGLGGATVSTFHGLCAQLLRRAPANAGVDPAFTLLDERESAALLREVGEEVVLEAVDGGKPGIAALCRDLGFSSEGRVRGLVELLCEVFVRMREEGLRAPQLRLPDPISLRAGFETAVADTLAEVLATRAALTPSQQRFAPLLALAVSVLDGLTLENFADADRFPRLRAAVLPEVHLAKQRGDAGPGLKLLRYRTVGAEEVESLADLYAGWAVAPQERELVELLEALRARHDAALLRQGALDFSELLVRARDLMRDHRHARAEAQARFRALLVDEFQDTNRLQLELVVLLAERRDGAPRAAEPGVELPLEPGYLCAVGDRKQSIYEFRGADVSVFESLAGQLEAQGGRRVYLQRNWRSSGPLLDAFNRLFAKILARPPEARDYEVAFEAGDALEPARAVPAVPPAVQRLFHAPERAQSARECRTIDATAVARHLHQLLSAQGEAIVRDGDGLRQVRGRDVAILFRRFTHLETYRQALISAGVPHRVVRGRGFYGAQEVLDLASLLAVVADEHDALSLAAVLRSPLVGLTDASLLQLAREGRGLDPRRALTGPVPEGWDPAEREALDRLRRLIPRLRAEQDRLSLRALLEGAIEALDFRVALAATPFAEQALANLDKLLLLANRRDERTQGGCAAFARELLDLASADPTEAQADLADEGDPRAVQLLTIHQAKGLEWPVVYVPDLSALPQVRPDSVLFDRRLGLALKAVGLEALGARRPPGWAAVFQELRRRAAAEHRRTLYVALTRAKDRLVLSGAGSLSPATGWGMIDRALVEDGALRALVEDVPVEALPTPRAVEAPPVIADLSAASQALERVRAPPEIVHSFAVWPVTELQDFVRCPRRYELLHLLGLAEAPLAKSSGLARAPEPRSMDPRRRGTLVHRLLERTPLAAVLSTELGEVLLRLLDEEGVDRSSPEGREVLSAVHRFWKTPLGQRLGRAGDARVHRELPFLLRLRGQAEGPALHLKGQLDLLFEEEDGSALVLDYKTSVTPASGLDAFSFQLDCYALAARALLAEGVPMRTGVAFLGDGGLLLRPTSAAQLETFEEAIHAKASTLLAASSGQARESLPIERCREHDCGFQYSCHPEAL